MHDIKLIRKDPDFFHKKISERNFKIDLKELSLFLETQKPEISFRGVSLPAQNIKVYLDFLSLIKSNS